MATANEKDTKDTKAHQTTYRDVLEAEQKLHPPIAVAAHLPANIDDPIPVAEPAAKLTPEQEKTATEKKELQKKVGESLAKHGGNESAVPSSDPYWSDIARLRMMS